MIYLLLAILSSAAISVLMRLSNKYVKNNMTMFSVNYLICGLLSYLFIILDNGQNAFKVENVSREDWIFAFTLGLISGVMFLVSFMLLEFNIKKNGLVLASTFMKLGVLVPVIMSIILGWDKPSWMQIAGCALAVAAIIVINGESNEEKRRELFGLWLIVLLLAGGFTDSLSNIYDKVGSGQLKNQYLLFIFVAAVIVSIITLIVKKQKFTLADALWGALIGVPNYFSARFLLYALSEVSAIVAYPVYNISVILIISLLGFIIFKEKLSKRKLLGIAVILIAILLLNI